uniref:Uncharacterized protein n=1 Tax=Kalanchoe fedtschenkoi TaxID=63787 RepID=A0A7N0TIT5_KALFE
MKMFGERKAVEMFEERKAVGCLKDNFCLKKKRCCNVVDDLFGATDFFLLNHTQLARFIISRPFFIFCSN